MPHEIVNTVRHVDVFNEAEFRGRGIDIIGVGAVGSWVATLLARLGIRDIRVWDDDIVEAHNVANQAYGICHIGRPKVLALEERIRDDTGITITALQQRVTADCDDFRDVVFLLVDSMESRRELIDAIAMSIDTKIVIETRMGVDSGRVYHLDPHDSVELEAWKQTAQYNDPGPQADEVENETACNATQTVGATAAHIASEAVWRFLSWFEVESGRISEMPEPNEVQRFLRSPTEVIATDFHGKETVL